MAGRAKQLANQNSSVQFPPEADADYPLVREQDIEAWNNKLEQRFDIGKGKLEVVHEL